MLSVRGAKIYVKKFREKEYVEISAGMKNTPTYLDIFKILWTIVDSFLHNTVPFNTLSRF